MYTYKATIILTELSWERDDRLKRTGLQAEDHTFNWILPQAEVMRIVLSERLNDH